MKELANLGVDRSALITALQAQNIVRPAGTIQTGDENLSLSRLRRLPVRAGPVATSTSPSAGACCASATSRKFAAAIADPPQPLFRVNGEPAIGLAIAMRDGGDILALGKNIKARWRRSPPICRSESSRCSSRIRPSRSRRAIAEFMSSLWQAIAIILAVSFISLGVRPGLVIALAIPLTLAIVFSVMELARHRHAAHFARRSHHCARPARRRRDDDHRCHAQAAGAGR